MPSAGRSVSVLFPLGGEFRGAGYAQREQPYTSPKAVNVRGIDAIERRARGGSRPGLSKLVDNDFGTNIQGILGISYVDTSYAPQTGVVVVCDGDLFVYNGSTVAQAHAYFIDDNGNYITDDYGNRIVFDAEVTSPNPLGTDTAYYLAEMDGKVYIPGSYLKRYNPATGVVDTLTAAPASQPLACVYQRRIVLAGANHMFYMSRMDNDIDYSFADDSSDMARAVAGRTGGSSVGYTATSLFQYDDKAVVFGSPDAMWTIYGNPAGDGRMALSSPYLGPISGRAFAMMPDGNVIFLSRRGLYMWNVMSEQEPQAFSDKVVPESLNDVSTSNRDVMMVYDHRNRLVHLFLTPSSAFVGEHWLLDVDRKALWPERYPQTMQPWAVTTMPSTSGYSNVILGCKDGYLRRFSDSATDDDGTAIQSDVLVGPFHTSGLEGHDGQIVDLVASLGEDSGVVDWRIITADSAESAVKKAELALATGDLDQYVDQYGSWVQGQNSMVKPRSRGPWAVLWLSSDEKWAYSSISMVVRRLGRLR